MEPLLTEQYADNGEFSHWHLIDKGTGSVLWSSFPEETKARGENIVSPLAEEAMSEEGTKKLFSKISTLFFDLKLTGAELKNNTLELIKDYVDIEKSLVHVQRLKETSSLLKELEEAKAEVVRLKEKEILGDRQLVKYSHDLTVFQQHAEALYNAAEIALNELSGEPDEENASRAYNVLATAHEAYRQDTGKGAEK